MIHFDGKTHVGKVRKDNEDCYACGALNKLGAYAVVCDGMGGANGGRVASTITVDTISEHIKASFSSDMDEDAIRGMLIEACEKANAEVYCAAAKDITLEGMGTTAIVAVIYNNTAHIIHIGDSRAYIIGKDEITQITNDHTMVQQLVDSGEISVEDARNHPQKNIITQAVGVSGYLFYDYNTVMLPARSKLLLCTDGLTNMVPDKKIYEIVSKSNEAVKLIDAALDAGGADNVTAVIIY